MEKATSSLRRRTGSMEKATGNADFWPKTCSSGTGPRSIRGWAAIGPESESRHLGCCEPERRSRLDFCAGVSCWQAMRMFGGHHKQAPPAGEAPRAFECGDRPVYDAEEMDEYVGRLLTRIAMLEAERQHRPSTHRLRARMDIVRGQLKTGRFDPAPFTWLEDPAAPQPEVDFWARTFHDADFGAAALQPQP